MRKGRNWSNFAHTHTRGSISSKDAPTVAAAKRGIITRSVRRVLSRRSGERALTPDRVSTRQDERFAISRTAFCFVMISRLMDWLTVFLQLPHLVTCVHISPLFCTSMRDGFHKFTFVVAIVANLQSLSVFVNQCFCF